MKIFLGIVIGLGLAVSVPVFAEQMHGIHKVGDSGLDGGALYKWYDYDNGVVCYTAYVSGSPGISCLHN